MTEEEYLMFERASDIKHEFLAGEVFAMTGASRAHNLITGNTYASLHGQLRGRPCEIYANDMRVKVSSTGLYTYPDIVAVCGEVRLADNHFDTLLNPTLIIEVLSASTADYDYGRKFKHYRELPSLREYVLIAQDSARVDYFVRLDDGVWQLTDIRGLDATLTLTSVNATLALADIYEQVTFPQDT
jgi:Uma2 family endonuclease